MSVTPSVSDAKAAITVNGGKPGSALALSLSYTLVKIEVTSPDGSSKQVTIVFTYFSCE